MSNASMVISETVHMRIRELEDGCIFADIPAYPGVYGYAYPGAQRIDGTIEGREEAVQRASDECCEVLRDWSQIQ